MEEGKNPSITHLGCHLWHSSKEKAAGNQKSEVTRPKTKENIRLEAKTSISEHQVPAIQCLEELHHGQRTGRYGDAMVKLPTRTVMR